MDFRGSLNHLMKNSLTSERRGESRGALSAAGETLVLSHMNLVQQEVSRIRFNLPPGVDRDDLVCVGNIGLIDAAQKFDPSKGAAFKTYAATRIRGSIFDELRRHSLGGQTLCKKARRLGRAVESLGVQKKSGATAADIAKVLSLSVADLDDLYMDIHRSFMISLDAIICESEDLEQNPDCESADYAQDPAALAEAAAVKAELRDAIYGLPDQEKRVMSLYYYEDLSLKEIGRVFEVSESRISQIHGKAVNRLRGRLKRAHFPTQNLEKMPSSSSSVTSSPLSSPIF